MKSNVGLCEISCDQCFLFGISNRGYSILQRSHVPINDGKTRKNLREFILLRSNWGCNLFFKMSLFPRKGTELRGKMDHNCRINSRHDN